MLPFRKCQLKIKCWRSPSITLTYLLVLLVMTLPRYCFRIPSSRSFHPLLHRPSAWSGHPRVLSCCFFHHAPGKEQGPKTLHQQFMEKYLKSLWGYSGVLGGCIICSVGTLEFFFETKSKVGSTRLWNTSLNLNQQAI